MIFIGQVQSILDPFVLVHNHGSRDQVIIAISIRKAHFGHIEVPARSNEVERGQTFESEVIVKVILLRLELIIGNQQIPPLHDFWRSVVEVPPINLLKDGVVFVLDLLARKNILLNLVLALFVHIDYEVTHIIVEVVAKPGGQTLRQSSQFPIPIGVKTGLVDVGRHHEVGLGYLVELVGVLVD